MMIPSHWYRFIVKTIVHWTFLAGLLGHWDLDLTIAFILLLFLFGSFTATSYTEFNQTNNETKEDTKSTHDYKDDVQMMVLIPGNVREDWSQNITTIHSISADIFNPPCGFVNWLHVSICEQPRMIRFQNHFTEKKVLPVNSFKWFFHFFVFNRLPDSIRQISLTQIVPVQ